MILAQVFNQHGHVCYLFLNTPRKKKVTWNIDETNL
jgi:hypothetical protein